LQDGCCVGGTVGRGARCSEDDVVVLVAEGAAVTVGVVVLVLVAVKDEI